MTIMNGIDGSTIPQLSALRGEIDVRYIAKLTESGFLDDAAREWLLELCVDVERLHRQLHLHFTPVLSTTVPYAVGSNQNRHPWPRVGNLYYYKAAGALREEVLRPVARDEDITDVLVWCCLAAE